ncbi:hypothetical protein E7744_11250 [Citricoccus sp. SGAir0253]|uniref:hypothetical protein n=1 Tax=Citricoccus sp. SGAir0253 TaxID=2567881 RepID=UPI0010CD5AEE|nr:hypothetical protein [Citricoccus sp. SGAir0253]QCU78662.1 hypothetical protein E7744_11250 [Citricoccus sp. SGAir0253]
MIAFLPLLLSASAAPTGTEGATGQPVPGVPEPTLRPGLDQAQVTPGIEGFLFTALMVAMAIVVIRLMVRSIRRVQYRSEQAEDMLVDRYQGYLPEDVRRPGDRDPDERPGSDVDVQRARLQKRYPGYLDSPAPEPKAPDSGRD